MNRTGNRSGEGDRQMSSQPPSVAKPRSAATPSRAEAARPPKPTVDRERQADIRAKCLRLADRPDQEAVVRHGCRVEEGHLAGQGNDQESDAGGDRHFGGAWCAAGRYRLDLAAVVCADLMIRPRRSIAWRRSLTWHESHSASGLIAKRANEAGESVAPLEGQWYVLHTYSGYENKVKKSIETRIEALDLTDRVYEIVVPTQEEIEIRSGQRHTVQRKVFPGYVLVRMEMDDDTWYALRNTPGVTGFVNINNDPVPLPDSEVQSIMKGMTAEAPRVKISFQVGDTVRIIDGPFADFRGEIDEINQEKGKIRVLVSFFGRETPVELDFLQAEREA